MTTGAMFRQEVLTKMVYLGYRANVRECAVSKFSPKMNLVIAVSKYSISFETCEASVQPVRTTSISVKYFCKPGLSVQMGNEQECYLATATLSKYSQKEVP